MFRNTLIQDYKDVQAGRNRLHDFGIVRRPLVIEGTATKVFRDAITREDNGALLGIVSSDYKLVQHREVVPVVEEGLQGIFGKEWSVKRECMTRNGGRLFIEYRFDAVRVEIKKGDFISMLLTLVNSLDGTTKIGFMLGALRLVCLNGMTITKQFFEIFRKHTNNLEIDEDMTNLLPLVKEFQGKLPGIQKLANTPVDVPMRLNGMIERNLIPERIIKVVGEKIVGDVATEWDLYNKFTSHLTHDYEGSFDRYSELQNRLATEFGI